MILGNYSKSAFVLTPTLFHDGCCHQREADRPLPDSEQHQQRGNLERWQMHFLWSRRCSRRSPKKAGTRTICGWSHLTLRTVLDTSQHFGSNRSQQRNWSSYEFKHHLCHKSSRITKEVFLSFGGKNGVRRTLVHFFKSSCVVWFCRTKQNIEKPF